MIEARVLTTDELASAIKLKIRVWREELAGKVEHELSFEDEMEFFTRWAKSEKEHHDRRILLGAFQEGKLLGAAFGSFAEVEDAENAMELNGLWVEEDHRGKGISLVLLTVLVKAFRDLGKDQMIVYNHHFAPSNEYYRKLGGEVIRQDRQMNGKLLVDVFRIPMENLEKQLNEMLDQHRNQFQLM